jgi:hypothetical protein
MQLFPSRPFFEFVSLMISLFVVTALFAALVESQSIARKLDSRCQRARARSVTFSADNHRVCRTRRLLFLLGRIYSGRVCVGFVNGVAKTRHTVRTERVAKAIGVGVCQRHRPAREAGQFALHAKQVSVR